MKKIVMTVVVLAMVMTSVMSVSAAYEGESNMDANTYLATRTQQVEDAFEDGLITAEEKALMLEHIGSVAAAESFGNGPSNGEKGDGNVECVMGEDRQLGIFRSQSAGMQTGSGNGIGDQLQDGTGDGVKAQNGQANGLGLRNQDGSGNGEGNGSEGAQGNRGGAGNGSGRN